MTSAYYSEKIPKYEEDIRNGTRKVVTFAEMRLDFITLALKYNVKLLVHTI